MRTKSITSADNPTYKLLFSLLSPRSIKRHNLAFISGAKITSEVAAIKQESCYGWVMRDDMSPNLPEIAGEIISLPRDLYRKLDEFGTNAPLLVVKTPAMEPWNDQAPWPKGITLFLALQNPDNLGATIRSAKAFGVARIVLLSESAHPFHPKSMRAAGTALLTSTFETGPSISTLTVTGAPLYALDGGGDVISHVTFPPTFGLLPGVEGPGLPPNLLVTKTLSIPISKDVESLNAGVATGIALYETQRQIKHT